MTKGKSILFYGTLGVVFIYFLVLVLVKAQSFLIPLVTAGILCLLVLPLAQKLEKGFLNRAWASLANTSLLILVSIGFMVLLSFQVKNVVDDWQEIKSTMTPKIEQLKAFILEHVPISQESLKLDEKSIPFMNESGGGEESTGEGTLGSESAQGNSSSDTSSGPGRQASTILFGFMGFAGNYLLTFIYIFFLLNYRRRFRLFLLKLFPEEKSQEVEKVISRSAEVAQQYLIGKLFLIALLAILYSVGLGLSGVDNFILVSVIAATLSIIPYIGNIIGFGIAMTFGYLTSGETGVLIGILITFSVAQFVESYILEPYVVGDKVDLHPFFVILAVVAGNAIWGVMGMILSIPIVAIINVVLLNIPNLRPFGFLLSNKSSTE